jgi:hypothetical protein
MSRTKSFKTLVRRYARSDKKFAEALPREGIDAMSSGDLDTEKAILSDYLKTVAAQGAVKWANPCWITR